MPTYLILSSVKQGRLLHTEMDVYGIVMLIKKYYRRMEHYRNGIFKLHNLVYIA